MAELILAREVRLGDVLDLFGDAHADPHRDLANTYEFEFSQVLEVKWEGKQCVVIGGEGFCVGFPPDHVLKLERHDSELERELTDQD